MNHVTWRQTSARDVSSSLDDADDDDNERDETQRRGGVDTGR